MNYSYETSLPPYREAPELKRRQADEVLAIIKKGANNLLQVSQVSGIPQAIISARVNDLIHETRIAYSGFTVYNNRKRKKIILVKPAIIGTQTNLFDHVK